MIEDLRTQSLVLNYGVLMAVRQSNGRVIRFGAFELDTKAGELRKSGIRLRLQGQPFQVLTLLLEHAPDVVTREEFQQKLWPSDTFVDFDHSLNTAVNKVREVLGDSATSPRFVETLARRGYRFVGPVRPEALPVEPPRPGPLLPEARNPVALHPDLDVPIPHRVLTRTLFALIQIMYLSFYLAALFRIHAVEGVADSFFPGPGAMILTTAVMITAGVGIPLRLYLLSAVGFDYRRLDQKFHRMFPFLLVLDQLWAIAPFLLIGRIGLGAAFAATAALLYLPFSERTLIRMAYGRTIA